MFGKKVKLRITFLSLAFVSLILIVFLVLKMSGWFEKKLGKGGIAIIEKIFGIILLAIAVKLFTTGIKTIFLIK